MKAILLLTTCFLFVGRVLSQTPVETPEQAKIISAPIPVFPDEARNPIYGDSVRLLMDVDKKGKVTNVLAFGPMAPCSNLKDPVSAAIRKAALAAAKDTVFEPVLQDGRPVEARLFRQYHLGAQTTLTEVDRMPNRSGVLNGKATSLPKPDYPAAARASRIIGTISVQILVGEDGRVISAGAISGIALFHEPAVRAASASRYEPTTFSNEPVKISGVVVYNFAPTTLY